MEGHTRLLWRAELGDRAVEHVQVVEEVDGYQTSDDTQYETKKCE